MTSMADLQEGLCLDDHSFLYAGEKCGSCGNVMPEGHKTWKMKNLDKYLFYDEKLLTKEPLFVVVGDYSGIVPNILGKQYDTVVFEACPLNYETLLGNLDIEARVLAYQKALTGKDGKALIYQYKETSSTSEFIRSNREEIGRVEVESLSVESFIKNQMPNYKHDIIDVMLLNCEGSEWAILREIIEKKLPVKQICVSLHMDFRPEDYPYPNLNEKFFVTKGNAKYSYCLLIKDKI